MKMFKYYSVLKEIPIPQIEGVDVYAYTELGEAKLIGVSAEDHTEFESQLSDFTEVVYAEIDVHLKNCHLYKQLNETATIRIREIYSVDDELKLNRIANALPKTQVPQEFLDYNEFVASVISEIDAKKVEYGLKESV